MRHKVFFDKQNYYRGFGTEKIFMYMKKLVLALLGVCCAVMIVPAQEVVSADTIKAVPAYATVDQQPVAQEVEHAGKAMRL